MLYWGLLPGASRSVIVAIAADRLIVATRFFPLFDKAKRRLR